MKKIFLFLIATLLLAGCSFLDFDETSGIYTREDMYKTYSNIKSMLTNVYGYMPNKDIADVGSAMRECGCDDAEYADPDASVQYFGNGNWSALSTVDTKWDLYNGIRAANEFLESIQTVDLSIYKYDVKYELQMEHIKYYPFEARVLRAFYFFELARRYGDIPMPLTMLTIDEANTIEKTSFDNVIEFIVAECTECAANLPKTYIGMLDDEFGRVTRGFAMALKAKALLYAASTLHNPSNDKAKWQKAAQAALDIINEGYYSLDPGVKVNNTTSPEIIMVVMRSESQSFERTNFPVRFTEGERTSMGGTYPSQDLVDAFQTAAGYDIVLTNNGFVTSDPDFDVNNPYEGRDPRFATTILANGMAFKGSTIQTFEGGADYSATRSGLGTVTGYYLRKYVEESTSFAPENKIQNKHHWIVSRYAEILLSYAEAANEFFSNPNGSDGTLTLTASDALNQVRQNAGMPAITGLSSDDFRQAVRREWRVEFAFEDHRFWDVRRWKIGPETQNKIDGVKIVRNSTGFDYSRFTVEGRTWAEKMYLYPIPQKEVFCNGNLTQNVGW